MSDARHAALAALFDRPRDELLVELGRAATPSFEGLPHDAVDHGRRIYKNMSFRVRATICSDDVLHELCTSRANRVAIASATLDLIASQVGLPAAATLAVLIVGEGLTSYCATAWAKES